MVEDPVMTIARQVCAEQADRHDSPEGHKFISGEWDHTVWMRLVTDGIRRYRDFIWD